MDAQLGNEHNNPFKTFFQKIKLFHLIEKIYDNFLSNIRIYVYIGFAVAILFGIMKTLLFNGFSVDSYQFYALSIKDFILTGKANDLFLNYYQRHRIVYPFIIAIIHILYPMNVSILACLINLTFAILSIWMMRKILLFLKFEEKVVELFTLFVTLSYNFLNFNFNVLVDYVSLAFFLLFLYFLIKFKRDRKLIDISYSTIFLLYSILAREHFILAVFLYLYLFNSWKIRISLIAGFIILVFVLLYTIPEKIPFVDQFIPPSYLEVYLNKHYFKLYLLLQQKWINRDYLSDFIKGTIKVGIFPSIVFLMLFNWRKLSGRNIKNRIKSQLKGEILIAWFVIFVTIYSTFYSNISSASGLRYWLPTSWILLIFISNNIIQNKIDVKLRFAFDSIYKMFRDKNVSKTKIIKTLNFTIILIFTLYPIVWSSAEWYINRESPTGTGPIYRNSYFNSMDNKNSITKFDTKFIVINEINNSYLEAIVQEGAFDEDNLPHRRARMSFALWFNVTEIIEIKIRLKSPNDAYWGLSLYEVSEDYAPVLGNLKYTMLYLDAPTDFQTYYFKIEACYLLRYIFLNIGGQVNSTVIWDYLEVNFK